MASGDFVTEAQVNDLVAVLAERTAKAIGLSAPADVVVDYTIQDDGSPTGSWPNRLTFKYQPDGGSAVLVSWFNEYGEFRVQPAKSNTVAFRIFGQEDNATTHSGDLLQICDNRVNRGVVFAVDQSGNVTIAGDVTLTTINGKTYYPIYPPGTTPSGADPDGLVVVTA